MSRRTSDRPRKRPAVFLSQAFLLSVVMLAVGTYVFSRFTIGIDLQQVQCLPYKVFIIDRANKEIGRGDYLAFRADERVGPWFPAGMTFIKEVVGLPGDRVRVENGQVTVRGESRGELTLLGKLERSAQDFARDEEVPEGMFWVMGTAPESYDSRYWGYVEERQVIGRAYPVF